MQKILLQKEKEDVVDATKGLVHAIKLNMSLEQQNGDLEIRIAQLEQQVEDYKNDRIRNGQDPWINKVTDERSPIGARELFWQQLNNNCE